MLAEDASKGIDMTKIKFAAIAVALSASCGFGSIAAAAPLAPAPIGRLGADNPVEHVDYACGPGRHITPFGVCRPNFYGGGFYGPRFGYGGGRRFYRGGGYGGRGYGGGGRRFGGGGFGGGGRAFGGGGRGFGGGGRGGGGHGGGHGGGGHGHR